MRSSHFVTSLLCLVLFSLSEGSCADTEAHAKRFDLRGIATAEDDGVMHYCTKLFLLNVR